MERGEDVVMEKVLAKDIRRYIGKNVRHDVAAMGHCADMEQTLVGELLALHRYLGVVLADEMAACAMGDGVH